MLYPTALLSRFLRRLSSGCARSLGVAALVASLMLAALPTTAVQADAQITTIASGLDNPRGLAFSPDGALYVAEAGRGGNGPCIPGPEGEPVCYGATGAVTRIKHGVQQRIATGLPSLASAGGNSAIGPHDISFQGKGKAAVVIGLGADPARRAELGPAGAGFGRLLQMTPNGKQRTIADVAGYEADANPDGGAIDSNPYAVLARGSKRIVVDAGGNSLVQVDAKGRISTLAVFPDRLVDAPGGGQMPMQAVPTTVALGPDGAYYVGQLTGFPFPPGGANVYRVVPGEEPTVYASGFTNIIDIAFSPNGCLYVLEISANGLLSGDLTGALIRVDPDGTRTTIASSGLVAPGGLAFGADGAIYVTNKAVFAGGGEVLRIQP